MFTEEEMYDEGVAWPSYVDFLSTFTFVLIIFVGSLLYLLSGDIRQRAMDRVIGPYMTGLTRAGITNYREGNKVILPLKGKVDFDTNAANIKPEHVHYLREIGSQLSSPDAKRIVILGFADSQPCRSDPFCNWQLSALRAEEVLKFFYLCSDCGYGQDVQRKLILRGEGNLSSGLLPSALDRRVDVIIEFDAPKE